MSTMTPACAHCHRDHQGRNFDLKRVTDAFCTGCHADLRAATEYKFRDLARSDEPFANRVTRFDGDHPDFRSMKGDTGRLRFNHKLHLALGMNTPEKGNPQFKLSKVEPSQQNRYRVYEGKDGLIQLDCGACHQLETADFGLDAKQLAGVPLAGLPQRAAGAYFLPIVYENQCKTCHPLSFERKNADDPQSGMKSVPHGWQPSQIHEMLQGHYTAEFLKGNLPSFQGPVKLPGKDATPGGSLKQKADEYIQRLVAKAEHDLFASQRSCAECHYPEPKEPPAGDWSKVRIAPPNVPQIWLKHARFDHAAHRAMKCTDCHADAQTSTSEKSVLVPNRDNCLQCHTAPGLLSSQGRARTDCAECHRYHNGDHGGMLQGIGASSRGVKSQLDVKSFLQGGP
jgi:predicted CXXCH cytochrome family protein